ncbi:MAG TPA: asparagine synthase (glutamine-hydrolyzing) [Candidatus Dormibacteraeota bacterium]|jgi:asparagine synthase (glutamine-hydrolysing)|nr:asparagine synthase (glutamine-hydrolyzing) [Candidatus Dormibacteraeota bacterium]
MCGICGVFHSDRNQRVNRDTLAAMNRQIVHRGPDDDGFLVEENVGLAMRRLSIIDIQTGHQPVSNEDGNIWVVFNGEIYNHQDLRKDLESRGHRYRTRSDTESIVHLYEEYGRDCVKHLRGMFAFAIWDRTKRSLFVARDRLGIKPLYYRYDGKTLLFGSEIKTILAHPGVKREFNSGTLAEYLAFGYITGEESMYAQIRKLLPGHLLTLDESGKLETALYWDLDVKADDGSLSHEHYVHLYREQLEQCVSSHLMSDVPLGVFLSGGLDSSAVAALTTKIRREPIETFSVGYGEEAFSELPYARTIAEHLKSKHHEVRLSRDEFFQTLPRLIWYEDEPIVWPSSVALYFVARLARERVTVVLTGEGSDETLGGYTRYAWTLLNSRMDRAYRGLTPAALRRMVRGGIDALPLSAASKRKLKHTFLMRDGSSWSSFYFDNFYSAFSAEEQDELLTPEAKQMAGDTYAGSMKHWNDSSGDLLHRLLYTDIKTYLVELLMKQDQMSMAASIESRVPFLDHELVEFTASIPAKYATKGMAGKCILKAAVEDLLPHSIVYRQKMGFPTPWAYWLAGPSLNSLRSLLMEPRTLERGLFRTEAIERLFADHTAGRRDHGNRIWRLLNLELWFRVCVEGDLMADMVQPGGVVAYR